MDLHQKPKMEATAGEQNVTLNSTDEDVSRLVLLEVDGKLFVPSGAEPGAPLNSIYACCRLCKGLYDSLQDFKTHCTSCQGDIGAAACEFIACGKKDFLNKIQGLKNNTSSLESDALGDQVNQKARGNIHHDSSEKESTASDEEHANDGEYDVSNSGQLEETDAENELNAGENLDSFSKSSSQTSKGVESDSSCTVRSKTRHCGSSIDEKEPTSPVKKHAKIESPELSSSRMSRSSGKITKTHPQGISEHLYSMDPRKDGTCSQSSDDQHDHDADDPRTQQPCLKYENNLRSCWQEDSLYIDGGYQIIEGGTQRGGKLLIDQQGYVYTERHGRKSAKCKTMWQCSMRNKRFSCGARVYQRDHYVFQPGSREHRHPPDPHTTLMVKAKHMVRNKIKEDPSKTASVIVKEVIKEMCENESGATEVFTRSAKSNLLRIASRQRCVIRDVTQAPKFFESVTEKGVKTLVDNKGYSYVIKKIKGSSIEWVCSNKKKPIQCRASMVQQGDTFEFGIYKHRHKPIKPARPFKQASEFTETCSQKGNRKIIDKEGYTYTIKSVFKDQTKVWRCTARNKTVYCKVLLTQRGDKFEIGTFGHNHDPKSQQPSDLKRSRVGKKVKKEPFVAEVIPLSCEISNNRRSDQNETKNETVTEPPNDIWTSDGVISQGEGEMNNIDNILHVAETNAILNVLMHPNS